VHYVGLPPVPGFSQKDGLRGCFLLLKDQGGSRGMAESSAVPRAQAVSPRRSVVTTWRVPCGCAGAVAWLAPDGTGSQVGGGVGGIVHKVVLRCRISPDADVGAGGQVVGFRIRKERSCILSSFHFSNSYPSLGCWWHDLVCVHVLLVENTTNSSKNPNTYTKLVKCFCMLCNIHYKRAFR